MKFMIAGLGSIGRRHLRNLIALGEHDILLYRTFRSTLPDDELSEFPFETDLPAALSQKPDGVIIANPTALHLEIAIPAALAGCHLLIEKPISHTMDGIDDLVKALDTGGGKALVAFQFRFHPGLQRIKNLLDDNAIGRPTSVRAHWGEYLPSWHPWEDYSKGYSARRDLGGGVILTLCHPLDYLSWLLGEVHTIWAFGDHLSDLHLDVEDTAEIGLKFSSRLIGSVHLNYIQRPARHHLEIVGTHGTIRWDNSNDAVEFFRAYAHKEFEAKPAWKVFPTPRSFERNDMFLSLMEHFIGVVNGKQEPRCTIDDGIQSLRLALEALKSIQLKRISQID